MINIAEPARMLGDREQIHAPSALAIDIGGTKTAFAWVGVDGNIVDSFRVPTPAPETARDVALRELRGHLQRAREWRTRFGTCIVVRPGLMSHDVVELSPNTPAWEDAALAQLVCGELGDVHVRFENDVRAATYGEMVAGRLRGVDPGLYVNLGTGVAAALVVNGRIVEGAHGAAGEIGYMKPSPVADAVRGDGVPPAPLEELLGGAALGKRASKMLGRAVSPRELFAAREPVALAFAGETATLISTMHREPVHAAGSATHRLRRRAGPLLRPVGTRRPSPHGGQFPLRSRTGRLPARRRRVAHRRRHAVSCRFATTVTPQRTRPTGSHP